MTRRTRNLFDRAQIAPLRIRRAPADPIDLHPSLVRVTLLRAINAGHVKPGQGRYSGGWRWDGVTVTRRVNELAHGGWITIQDAPKRHLDVTTRGGEILAAHPGDEGQGRA